MEDSPEVTVTETVWYRVRYRVSGTGRDLYGPITHTAESAYIEWEKTYQRRNSIFVDIVKRTRLIAETAWIPTAYDPDEYSDAWYDESDEDEDEDEDFDAWLEREDVW